MKVKLKSDFSVAPYGHTTEHYKAGDEVEGRVAELAVSTGHAEKRGPKPKKETPKPSFTKPAEPDHEG